MSTSESSIRAADLSRDRAGIQSVLQRNLPGAGEPGRVDWLYRANPDGAARVWVAVDEDDRIVGSSAAYPRRVRVDGEIVRAIVLSDFAFDANYRSLGPALRLLKATLAPVREDEYVFSYDFPSATMRAIYRRLGSPDLGPAVRWTRPLRLSGAIRRRMGSGALSAATGAAADALLTVRDSFARTSRGCKVAELEGPFDSSFDELDVRLGQVRRVVGVRDATYLNWKYSQHAMWRHRTLTASLDGRLEGFAVFRSEESGALRLVDLFADSDPVRRALVAGLVRLGRRHGMERIDVEALDDAEFSRMLGDLGFVRREDGVGPIPYMSPGRPALKGLTSTKHWWLTGGDRDI